MTMLKNLITFGDSWVWGVGAGYQKGQTKADYKQISHDESYTKHSFRSLICKKHNLSNRNFSIGGASNQQQFRFASEFFIASKLRDLTKKQDNKFTQENMVLWGLTSVYRHEVWNIKKSLYENIFMTHDVEYAKNYSVNHLNENVETERLYFQVELFNAFFKTAGIKNYWFNVFNEHKFPKKIPNMLFNGMSLLSILTDDYQENDKYHKSDWKDTDRKIQKALDMNLVNPYSLHPTKQGHEKLFKLLETQLDFNIGTMIG